MARKITTVVIHCSATRPSQDISVADIRRWHTDPVPKGRGWSDVGYHYVITRKGDVQAGRPVDRAGAHAVGHNANSIGVCLAGGVDAKQNPDCNFTRAQWNSLSSLVESLLQNYGPLKVVGHRDLSPDRNGDGVIDASERLKACPCFDVTAWMGG